MRKLSRRTLFALPLALPAVGVAAAKPTQAFANGGVIARVAAPLVAEAGQEVIVPRHAIKTLSIEIESGQLREAIARISTAAADARASEAALSQYVGG
jgi:hypothetical protein